MREVGFCQICGQQATNVLVDGSGWCPDHGRVILDVTRPQPPVVIRDREGEEIRRGMVVVEAGREVGIVTAILEADDEQGPRVEVDYHDRDLGNERWGVRDMRGWHDLPADYICDDVEVRP